MSEHKIKIAGYGGQGVVLAGNIIARGCMLEDRYVTGMVSYGVEMRGGTANATLVISDQEIASPVVEHPDIAIVLNQQSLEKFEPAIVTGGLIIINDSIIDTEPDRDDLDVVTVGATDIAKQLGDIRVANLAAVGAFIKVTSLLRKDSVLQAVEQLFSKKKKEMVAINTAAFEQGYTKAVSVKKACV